MKTLLILRHAKATPKDEGIDDFDRGLNDRGKRDATRMGLLLNDEHLLPDLIVASNARRARKTAELAASACGFHGETRLKGELYGAGRGGLLEAVCSLPDTASRVLLVGHNPELEELLELLIGSYRPLATATLAQVELPIDGWRQTGERPALLKNLWQPREL